MKPSMIVSAFCGDVLMIVRPEFSDTSPYGINL